MLRVFYDRETVRPKGFRFCEFADEAGAQNSVKTPNGADFCGCSLTRVRVKFASRDLSHS
ncbi:unnamed protein product [Nippostrongylus brasiliensis]|uniref:RRM domain-containing protein n=1 Tax=Nippostrongylus brasiliensis TaxID=27835 RepID=A0A0N4XXY4_NIPBR|nr:unnamed protein product [Nippostrongylus brasiliensis]